MRLLFAYSYKNIFTRKLTSILTIAGVALVVFVFCAVLMLSHGLQQTLVQTGNDNNAIVVRKAANTEIVSILPRGMANTIKTDPAITRNEEGEPLFAGEILFLISQRKRGGAPEETSNIPIRGVSEHSFTIRPDITITRGRIFREGTSEVITGSKVAGRFEDCEIGDEIRFATRDWTVVGVFDGEGSGFESEIWGDYDQLSAAFERPIYSSCTMRLNSPGAFDEMKKRLENDPRLTVDVKREKQYYYEQSSATTTYISILGTVISVIFSIGAIVGAMITMYAAVANRTTEIGTLRALGFSRFTVLLTFLGESLLIALLGGVLGIVLASNLRFFQISTTNWDTFAELAFSFEISPEIVINALIFALVMGFIGGFLPAARAARLRIVNALRSKGR